MVVINSILAALRLLVLFTTFTSVTFHDSKIVYQTANYLALKSKKRDPTFRENYDQCNHTPQQ